jgi:hypothetical protein
MHLLESNNIEPATPGWLLSGWMIPQTGASVNFLSRAIPITENITSGSVLITSRAEV